MILNDRQITEMMGGCITPFTREKVRTCDGHGVVSYGLGHFGYDLRLSSTFKFVPIGARGILDPHNPDEGLWVTLTDLPYFDIQPGQMVLGVSVEYIRMPSDVIGIAVGKSTYARCGIVANVTPIEAGWEGYLTIELSNTAPLPVRVYAGEGIVQIVFLHGDAPDLIYSGGYQRAQGIELGRVG